MHVHMQRPPQPSDMPLLVDGSAGSASAGAEMSPPSTSDSDADLLPPIPRSDKFRSLPLSSDEPANNEARVP